MGDIPFANFVDAIGDGAGPGVSLDKLDIVTDAEEIMQFIYPDHIVQDSTSCLTCATLAPTNQQVDQYNDVILQHIHGTQHVYLAVDTLKEANNAGPISPDSALDYTACQTPGPPSHTLTVKVNGVYHLLQNFSLDRGLVKNVHVVVEVGTRIVTVRLLCPGDLTNSEGEADILIPRISLLHQLPSGHTLLCLTPPISPCTSLCNYFQFLSRPYP